MSLSAQILCRATSTGYTCNRVRHTANLQRSRPAETFSRSKGSSLPPVPSSQSPEGLSLRLQVPAPVRSYCPTSRFSAKVIRNKRSERTLSAAPSSPILSPSRTWSCTASSPARYSVLPRHQLHPPALPQNAQSRSLRPRSRHLHLVLDRYLPSLLPAEDVQDNLANYAKVRAIDTTRVPESVECSWGMIVVYWLAWGREL